jgi:HSP20 family protein
MRAPSVDVTETDDEVRIEAELPGVDEKDVEVTLADDVLTIRGEKRAEAGGDDKGRRWSERTFGSFERALRLAGPVQADQAKATFHNGVLQVRVPKSAEEKERVRKIPIQGDGGGG